MDRLLDHLTGGDDKWMMTHLGFGALGIAAMAGDQRYIWEENWGRRDFFLQFNLADARGSASLQEVLLPNP